MGTCDAEKVGLRITTGNEVGDDKKQSQKRNAKVLPASN